MSKTTLGALALLAAGMALAAPGLAAPDRSNVAIAVSLRSSAANVPAPPVTFASESKLWLTGDSTLHRYSSQATEWHIAVTLPESTQNSPAERLARGFSHLEIDVPVGALKSGEGLLDTNMAHALKSDRYPTIRFSADRGTVSVSPAGDVQARADGTLLVAGVERPADVEASGRLEGDTLHLTGSKTLSMKAFDVAPPTLFLGTVRVADPIEVHFDLTARL
ncbi:MAG TPA: YceI family protein [Oscillatoriaceae cyanobacterium]